MLPLILGLAGETPSEEEIAFIRAAEPAGFILFARNCRSRAQVRALTDRLKEATGRSRLPILVDQEGGRVARLRPPEWPAFPAPAHFGALFERAPVSAIEACRANGQALAAMLREVGITIDCFPLLDLRHPGAHAVIGDRAFSDHPLAVAALARATLEGLAEGGLCAMVKHMPGHGRAEVDSHDRPPLVEAPDEALEADLGPFRALRDAPFGMVAHIVYAAWDAEHVASQSRRVIGDIIRGRIGFSGLLLSDDIGMGALSGSPADRAASVIDAGCDLVLSGSADLPAHETIAAALTPLPPEREAALTEIMAAIEVRDPPAYEAAAARRDALLAFA